MENNTINMQKIDDIMTTVPNQAVSSSRKISKLTQFFSKQTDNGLHHRKMLFITIFIVLVLGMVLFLFKDMIFNRGDENAQNYQQVIDQSFREGYKTNYTYDESKIKAISESVTPDQKTKPINKKTEEALVNAINN
jgi:hypothetical protein